MAILITMSMPTLHIFGDSFTVPAEVVTGRGQKGLYYASPAESWNGGRPRARINTWINLVASELSLKHKDLDLVNYSQYGVAQDFTWDAINTNIDTIGVDDYVIIAVTHPNRFWYIREHPNLSNHHIINLEQYIEREQAWAIKLFMQYIQRPELDTLHQTNRMKSLAYEVLKRGLRRPLMLNCFATDISAVENIEELQWARGNLYSVQDLEFTSEDMDSTQYFEGVDCRYNHLCLTNHRIMADKVMAAFNTGETVDLNQGFVQGLLKENSLDDLEFCERELDADKMAIYREEKKDKKTNWVAGILKK